MNFFILGDSAYALKDTIITPYPSDVAAGMVTKALFSVRYAYQYTDLRQFLPLHK